MTALEEKQLLARVERLERIIGARADVVEPSRSAWCATATTAWPMLAFGNIAFARTMGGYG